jgi:rRNA maturation RNase YbeY
MTFDYHNLTVTAKGTLPKPIQRVPFLDIKNKILGTDYELSIAFIPAKEARALNINHRAKEYTPNTLSFSLSKKSGEIILCLPAIRLQYRSWDMPIEKYVTFLVIHSMLHLKGYAHSGTMERKEKQLLALFS